MATIKYGTDDVDNIMYESSQVDKLMFGNTLVWPIPANPFVDLTHYWNMNENTGTAFNDTVGSVNGNIGTLGWTTSGKDDDALHAASQYYGTIASNGYGTFNKQEFTINAWIYVTVLNADRHIWSYDNTGHTPPYYSQQLRIIGDGSLYFGTNANGVWRDGFQSDSSGLITENSWHMCSVTMKNGVCNLYVNGVNVKSDDTWEGSSITYYNQEVWLGRANYSTLSWTMTYDELGFWDRELTQTDFTALYNSGTGLFYTGT